MPESVRVLHVDDDESFGDLVVDFLEREDDRIEVVSVLTPEEGREVIERESIDGVISDYDMPGENGLEFLASLRETYPDLPFILFTGKGSEEVASDAMSTGATDYFQKTGNTEQYELLTHRVLNAVEKHRSKQERQRVYQALETATQGIGIIGADGRYQYLNEAYANLYGLDPEDVIGTHWEQLYPTDEVDRFNNVILPKLDEHGRWTGRSRGLHVDGTVIPEELSLTALDGGGHVCVIQDISARVEREQRLQLRNRAINEAPIGVIITDPAREDNPIIYVNDAFVDMTGYPRDEALGRNCRFLQGEDTEPEAVAELRAGIEAEREVVVELLNYRKDGEPFRNRVHVKPLRDDEGAVLNFVGFQEDVTDRR